MRLSTSQMFNASVSGHQKGYAALVKTQEQITSGHRLHFYFFDSYVIIGVSAKYHSIQHRRRFFPVHLPPSLISTTLTL